MGAGAGLTMAEASAEPGVSAASVHRWKKLLAESPIANAISVRRQFAQFTARHDPRPRLAGERFRVCSTGIDCTKQDDCWRAKLEPSFACGDRGAQLHSSFPGVRAAFRERKSPSSISPRAVSDVFKFPWSAATPEESGGVAWLSWPAGYLQLDEIAGNK